MTKILIICPIGLGNFIMATPAISGLKSHLGDKGELFLLALKPGIREMAKGSNWFKKVFHWNPDRESLTEGIKTLQEIRKEKFDISLSLFPTGHWKFALYTFFCGVKIRAGFIYPTAGIAKLTQTLSFPYNPELHDVDQNKELVMKAVSGDVRFPESLSFPLEPSGPTHKRENENEQSKKYFVCHPGSSSERGMVQKRLPLKTLKDVIAKICTTFDLKCFVLGGEEENALKEDIKGSLGNYVIAPSTKSLQELGEVIAGSEFFLGNDSGLMHISEALQKRCAVFFGPSNENRTGPYIPLKEKERQTPYHLIIRHPKDNLQNKSEANPKLAFAGSHFLQDLKPEDCWKNIEEFVTDVMKEN